MVLWPRRWHPDKIYRLKVERIVANPHQPRRRIDPEQLSALARSIQENGVLVPVLVRPMAGGRKFELVAGHRRLMACRKLGLASVPALVRPLTEEQIVRLGLLENMHRANLSPVEEAGALRSLATDFALISSEEVARRVGLSPEEASRRMRLLDLPILVQEALIVGLITPEHAEVMLGVADPDLQVALLRRIHREGFSPREARRWLEEKREGGSEGEKERGSEGGEGRGRKGGRERESEEKNGGTSEKKEKTALPREDLTTLARETAGLIDAFCSGTAGLRGDVERAAVGLLRRVRVDPASALAWNPDSSALPSPVPHAIRTAVHAVYLADRLRLPERDILLLGASSLLGDAGLRALPPALLAKRGPFTVEERLKVQRHVLDAREGLLAAGMEPRMARLVEQHHERFNGSGYPACARGSAIDPLALWVGIMDMYTALGESRPWRQTISPRKAVQQVLLAGHRGLFPKHLLRDFVHVFGLFPVGSRVRLRSGREGVVSHANAEAVQKPAVRLENGDLLDLSKTDDEILAEV